MPLHTHDWVGLTVAQVLARCHTPYEEVELIDEPPGKLRSLAFVCHQAQPGAPVRVVLQAAPGLFTPQRDWSRALVEAQTVASVVSRPQDEP
jgi:hypothetical protein